MRMSRLVRWLAVVAVVTGIAAPAPAEQPIRFGASLSTTGKYAALGELLRDGYLLCQKDINGQGGLLGRKLDLIVLDDESESEVAVRNYEKLIVTEKVDALLGPVTSLSTDAAANLAEGSHKVMIAPMASTTTLWERGRKYLFMVRSPSEIYLEGFIDLAARNGLKTVAFISEDTNFPRSVVRGAVEQAKKRGMEVVFQGEYPKGTTDFSGILGKVKAAKPDVLGTATFLLDVHAITTQMKELDLNVKMVGTSVGTDRMLGKEGEDAFGASQWEPGLPFPGLKEFVEAYKKEFDRDAGEVSAGAYASCQVLAEAVRRAKSLDGGKLREQLLKLRTKTVFGDFAVDERGYQVGHKLVLTQWQSGRWLIVWPENAATGKLRFPTPPWSQR